MKISDQKLFNLGKDQKRWPRLPFADLHFGQIGEGKDKKSCSACVVLE